MAQRFHHGEHDGDSGGVTEWVELLGGKFHSDEESNSDGVNL